jgi:hypothetical protein
MAQTYNFDGTKLVIPGAYIKTKVLNENAGVAATGIIALIGEADSGPAYSELKAAKNISGISGTTLVDGSGSRVAFSPDEISLVQGMFGSGRLVDAFAALSAPFSGVNALTGTPSLVYVIKTNAGTKASIVMVDDQPVDVSVATLKAKNYGLYGNLIDVEAVVGNADATTFLKPVTLTVKYNASTEQFVFNKKSPLKVKSTAVANLVITATTASIHSVGTFNFSDFPTYTQLAAKLGSANVEVNSGYEAQSPSVVKMDEGSYAANAYVPCSGYELSQIASAIIDVSSIAYKTLGANPNIKFGGPSGSTKSNLASGAMGDTTDDEFKAALKKLELVNANFIVPLISQDASLDTDDSASTYTLNNVVKNTVDHVARMSAVKLKKNRQAFLSHNGTYANAVKLLNNNEVLLNTPYQFRGSLAFQGIKALDAFQNAKDFQPWMVSVLAAAAQSVAAYRPIFNKGLNILGVANPTDYEGTITEQEDALQSGLLTLAEAANGIDTILLSDQTSYLVPDNNFVYNSVQAVYGADVISTTIQQQMQVFVGQSNADVTPGVALAYLQSVMGTLLVNRWIASSIDAPNGYKNAKVSINGPVMNVSLEAKESTGIYFVPINLSISAVKN